MQQLVINVPAMYGDHHVMQVRQILLAIEGVSGVTASGARRKVAVDLDEKTTSADAVVQALAAAGYTPDEAPAVHVYPDRHKDGSEWHTVAARVTTTERKDREMAGDFRRY